MHYEWPAKIGNKSLFLRPLLSSQEREDGYQYCQEGPDMHEGLLFIFEDEAPRKFHMNNVNFDLDLLGFNSDLQLVFVLPMISNAHMHYDTLPCKYAVEVRKGWADNIPIGASKLVLL